MTEENEDRYFNVLRKSDLRFMPELTCLKYGMHCWRYFNDVLLKIEMDDWNMEKKFGAALEELYVYYGPGK